MPLPDGLVADSGLETLPGHAGVVAIVITLVASGLIDVLRHYLYRKIDQMGEGDDDDEEPGQPED